MRRLELLITQARRATENVEHTDTSGIDDEEFIEYANNAQDQIFSQIMKVHPHLFEKEITFPVISGQEAYDLPKDLYLGTRIVFMEYSSTGSSLDFLRLPKGKMPERLSGAFSTPAFYLRRGSQLLLEPKPREVSGIVRMTYQRTVPRLDIRRGTVQTATVSGQNITSLVLDPTVFLETQHLPEEGYITIVDKDGLVKMQSIPVTNVSPVSGVVTFDPAFQFQPGETIPVGAFAVRGPFTTTTCQLSDLVERYLISYINWKILKRDSSNDSQEQSMELENLQNDIVSSFSEADEDVDTVAILDSRFLTTEGF